MNRLVFLRTLICALTFLFVGADLMALTKAGAIKAVKITGQVTRTAADGKESPVTENQVLIETDTIRTAGNSSVVLVFANGASVKLGETTRLAIVEFKMDPLDEDIAVAALEREPTTSVTRLHLDYGEMVGNVKTLNTASSYDVRTPVGAAGIRGTTFRILLRFDAQGQANFVLSTFEGRVVFSGTIPTSGGEVTQTGGTQEVSVETGAEVIAIATVDTTTGVVSNIQVAGVTTISPAAQTAITTAVTQAIQQAQQSTTFNTTEQQTAAQNTPPPSGGTSTSTPQTGQPQTETQNPTNQNQTRPSTTPQTPLDTTQRSGSG